MASLAKELGGTWETMFNEKSAIRGDQVTALAKALSVRTDGLKSFSTEGWAMLVKKSPTVLLGWSPNATMGHAIVLAGLKGDTNDFQNLKAKTIDPDGGKSNTVSFKDLVEFYEGAAHAGIPQVMLLP